MNAEAAKKLREKFPAEAIGKLPRLTCKACSEKRCTEHKKQKCDVCGNYISPRHIHLDYVGHAAVTDRLLQVDPEWSWHPFTVDELAGVNAQKGELWIWLTIAGHTRPGVGDGETAKVRIGDALRNAAMRFGVGLDLWAKEEFAPTEDEGASGSQTSSDRSASPVSGKTPADGTGSPEPASTAQSARLHAIISDLAKTRDVPREQVQSALKDALGIESMANLSVENAKRAGEILEGWQKKVGASA